MGVAAALVCITVMNHLRIKKVLRWCLCAALLLVLWRVQGCCCGTHSPTIKMLLQVFVVDGGPLVILALI